MTGFLRTISTSIKRSSRWLICSPCINARFKIKSFLIVCLNLFYSLATCNLDNDDDMSIDLSRNFFDNSSFSVEFSIIFRERQISFYSETILQNQRFHQSYLNRLQFRKYKIIFVIVSAQVFSIWKIEIAKYFSTLKFRIYVDRSELTFFRKRHRILKFKIVNVLKYLNKFFDSFATLLFVILTSYIIWNFRTIYWKSDKVDKIRKRTDDDASDQKDENERELIIEQLQLIYSYFSRIFDCLIFDEAQKIKSMFIIIHKTLTAFEIRYVNMLNVIFMMNKSVDLIDFLNMLFKNINSKFFHSTRTNYVNAKRELLIIEQMLSADDMIHYDYLLNSTAFKSFATTAIDGTHIMLSDVANDVIFFIFRFIVLRRTASSIISNVHGVSIRIDAEFSHDIWRIIELSMNKTTQFRYDEIHRFCASLFGRGFSKKTKNSLRSMTLHRRLCHVVLNSQFDKFYRKSRTTVTDLKKWYTRYSNHGVIHFFNITKFETWLPVYENRSTMVKYFFIFSVKLRFLVVVCHQICVVYDRKILIFCDWSFIGWHVEHFMMNLKFNFVAVRFAHSTAEKKVTINAFTNVNHFSQIFVTSLRIFFIAINFQSTCFEVFFVNVSTNVNIVLQIADRILRLSQTQTCFFTMLTIDHIYDQILQAHVARKMIFIIAEFENMQMIQNAFANLNSDGSNAIHNLKIDDDEKMNDEDLQNVRRERLRKECVRFYVNMFEFRFFRHEWNDIKNLTTKDELSIERIFREIRGLFFAQTTFKQRDEIDWHLLSADNFSWFDHSFCSFDSISCCDGELFSEIQKIFSQFDCDFDTSWIDSFRVVCRQHRLIRT